MLAGLNWLLTVRSLTELREIGKQHTLVAFCGSKRLHAYAPSYWTDVELIESKICFTSNHQCHEVVAIPISWSSISDSSNGKRSLYKKKSWRQLHHPHGVLCSRHLRSMYQCTSCMAKKPQALIYNPGQNIMGQLWKLREKMRLVK